MMCIFFRFVSTVLTKRHLFQSKNIKGSYFFEIPNPNFFFKLEYMDNKICGTLRLEILNTSGLTISGDHIF